MAKWENLKWYEKTYITIAAILESMFMIMVAFDGANCFRNFQLSNKISDPIDKGGLGGDVTEIVLPLGWVALIFFFVGSIFIYIERKIIASRITKEKIEN